MVVARADMAVAGELGAFAPDDDAQLGVRLELDEAIDDVHARVFQIARPADIGRLVKAGLELDDGGHRLARLYRLLESLHDGAVARGAVERPLDGHHVGIGHGLAQVLHDDVERLVGVVDDDVLLAHRGKAIAVELADALGEAADERLEQKIWPIGDDELRRIRKRQEPVLDEDGVLADLQLLDHEALQAIGHRGVELEADHVAAAAALQRAFERAHQILGFLLHLDIAVAQDAERTLALYLEAGEQLVEEQSDHRLQPNEAQIGGMVAVDVADANEALKLTGERNQSVHRLAVAVALHLDDDDEPPIEDEGEGMRRIDGDRGQDGEHVGHEQALQPAAFGRAQILLLEDLEAGFRQFRAQLAPAGLLVGDETGSKPIDGPQLLRRRQAVLRDRLHAGLHLPVHAGDAHHVELVEIGGRDRQEAQALQQRVALVGGLLENAPVELQPGELAVVEAIRPLRRTHLYPCHHLGRFFAHPVPGACHLKAPPLRRSRQSAGRVRHLHDIRGGR